MSYALTGTFWTPAEFREYLATLDLTWCQGITMHHTAAPSLAQRPDGLSAQHMRNLRDYYQKQLGWSAGPHLFVDDHRIAGLSPLTAPGTHARSFNRTHIGIEVLGDYDSEDPSTGRGALCWDMAAEAVRALLDAMPWLSPANVNGHRDDPKTDKTCPGRKIDLDAFRARLTAPVTVTAPPSAPDAAAFHTILDALQWQLDKLRRFIPKS